VDDYINLTLGGNMIIIDVGPMQVYFLGQYVKQTGSINTADIQLIKYKKNRWKKVSK